MRIAILMLRDFINRLVSDVRKLVSHDDFQINLYELKRLEHSPRYLHTVSPLLGKHIELTDPFWYLYTHNEIFMKQIYKFHAHTQAPYIIDCGANIGLSVIYFKYLYPDARILAFEPDPDIFRVLERNIKTYQIDGVTLLEKAVWSIAAEVPFQPTGSVGGRLINDSLAEKLIPVQTVRLRNFLLQRVDFLKIDIEGAEYEVLQDCRDLLENVDHLFFEYHGRASEPQALHEMLNWVQSAGFRYHIQDSYPIRYPFLKEERNTFYDLILNVFAFRNHE